MSATPVRRRRLPVIAMPASRAECRGPGLCPKFLCRYNITLEITEHGRIKVPDAEGGLGERPGWTVTGWEPGDGDEVTARVVAWLDQADMNCALDIAEATGGETLEEVAERLGVTKKYISKIELVALRRIAATPAAAAVLRQVLEALAAQRDAGDVTDYSDPG